MALNSLLLFIFFIIHSGVCDWTFSLRITSARCCRDSNLPCDTEQGSCEDLTVGVCLRQPNIPMNNRDMCSLFLRGSGRDIIGAELNSTNFNTFTIPSILTTEYQQGGLQIFVGVATVTTIIPPYSTSVVDVILERVEVIPGGGEVSIIGIGENQRIDFTFLITVDCSPGFSGDGCNETITSSLAPTTTTIMISETPSLTQKTQPTNTPQITESSTETSTQTISDDDDDDTVAIIVGVVVGVVVVSFLIILIIILALCIFFQLRKSRKTTEQVIPVHSLENSTQEVVTETSNPETHIYSTINKDKKKRRPPPIIPSPYQVPLTETENETTPSYDQVSEDNHVEEESRNEEPTRNSEGLLYAELDHENGADRPKPHKPKTTPKPLETPVTYSTVQTNHYSVPRTPPQPANPDGETSYYSIITNTN